MKLYYMPGACSQAVHITAREIGLVPALVKVDIREHRTETGDDYLAINPRGYVPLLELDDGTRLTEVAALIEYLADQKPAEGLLPAAGTVERARVIGWTAFIATELHKSIGPLWDPSLPPAMREVLLTRLQRSFIAVERQLKEQDWLAGGHFTIADAYAFPILSWTRFLKLDMTTYPSLTAYLERVAARPMVRETLKAEGLI